MMKAEVQQEVQAEKEVMEGMEEAEQEELHLESILQKVLCRHVPAIKFRK
jgi:hypothetical protein